VRCWRIVGPRIREVGVRLCELATGVQCDNQLGLLASCWPLSDDVFYAGRGWILSPPLGSLPDLNSQDPRFEGGLSSITHLIVRCVFE